MSKRSIIIGIILLLVAGFLWIRGLNQTRPYQSKINIPDTIPMTLETGSTIPDTEEPTVDPEDTSTPEEAPDENTEPVNEEVDTTSEASITVE